MRDLEHIGIAVQDLEQSEALFTALFGQGPYKREEVESEGVMTSFFKRGTSKIELLSSVNPPNAISKFLEKRGEGMHHIAFAVNDLSTEIERLRSAGFRLVNDVPKRGADHKQVVFLHPKDTSGVLIELCAPMEIVDEGMPKESEI